VREPSLLALCYPGPSLLLLASLTNLNHQAVKFIIPRRYSHWSTGTKRATDEEVIRIRVSSIATLPYIKFAMEDPNFQGQ
jgi:hypothetical protein